MAFENPFKLEKLKIEAYSDSARKERVEGSPFEVMFNPTSFQQKYEIAYGKFPAINGESKEVNYSHSRPAELNLKLILDGTGVHEMGIAGLGNQKTVAARVSDFLNLTYHMNGKVHEPNYLAVVWGTLKFWNDPKFDCRLSSVNVTYTNFDRDGSALRAELDVVLLSDEAIEKRVLQANTHSPDLTHSRLVKSGDTLPLLCQQIYGKSLYYLRVAQVNQLDDFRNLTPGQTLIFPPLAKQ